MTALLSVHDHTAPPGPIADPSPATVAWAVRPTAVTRTLAAMTAAFLTASVAGQVLARVQPDSAVADRLMRATNAGLEGNLPSLYNAALLLAGALLLGLLARVSPRAETRGWRTLTWVFAYLTADEYLHVHELLTAPVRGALHVDGMLHYAWVIPYAALGAVLLAAVGPFLRRLPPRTRRGMLLAGALYVGGAVGLEMVGGRVDSVYGEGSVALLLLSTAEEAVEMSALTLFIGVLLAHVRAHRPGTAVHVSVAPGA